MTLSSNIDALVRGLRFTGDARKELSSISLPEWQSLLPFTDRSQITLPLGLRCSEFLPPAVQERIGRNLEDNRVRHERVLDEYKFVAAALNSRAIPFLVLKGLANIAPFYAAQPFHRPQYDIDLYCPPEYTERARETLADFGFTPVRAERSTTDHLPAMLRNRNWTWRDDYYASDLPLTVELHFRFWDSATERIPAIGIEQFWQRRIVHDVCGVDVPALSLTDSVSYSALHLIRHLLRGDLRIYHVYELAYFLNQTAKCHEFWEEWIGHRKGRAPIIESVAFRLAAEWFACTLPPVVEAAVRNLPRPIARWFDLFAFSPLRVEEPNKDELFLHLSLVTGAVDRCRILRRRLLPLPSADLPVIPQTSKRTPFRAILRHAAFLVHRAAYHLRSALALFESFWRWKASDRGYATN